MTAPAVPAIITEPFGNSAVAGDITVPIPVASQIAGGNPGRASFEDGFPPANFAPSGSGGIPPSGKDFNGILYMVTAYLAFLQSGQEIGYSAAASTAFGGYPLGAIVQQAANAGEYWISYVANNTTDPDTGGAGWYSTAGNLQTDSSPPGNVNNFALTSPGDIYLDVNAGGSTSVFTGFVAQRDGQRLVITNVGASGTVTVGALNGASSAANQIRALGDFGLGVQYASLTLQYSTVIGKWIPV